MQKHGAGEDMITTLARDDEWQDPKEVVQLAAKTIVWQRKEACFMPQRLLKAVGSLPARIQ